MIEAVTASALTFALMLVGQPSLRAIRDAWRGRSARSPQPVAAPSHVLDDRLPLSREFAAAPQVPTIIPASQAPDAIGAATAFLKATVRAGAYGMACLDQTGAPQYSHNRGHVFTIPFLIEALGTDLDEVERQMIITRILSEEQNGAWGYSLPGKRHVVNSNAFHVDADDTAFVLRGLHLLDLNRSVDCLLRFYRKSDGLFVTFDDDQPAVLSMEWTLRNNRRAHPEVNLNIYRVLKDTHLDHLIRPDLIADAQHASGFWRSYYYPSRLYATELACQVLDRKPRFASALVRSIGFVAGTQNDDGSWGEGSDPYETAMALNVLAYRPGHEAAVRRGVAYLHMAIERDGSWRSDAVVWHSALWAGGVWSGYDNQRSHVTARCLIALKAARAAHSI